MINRNDIVVVDAFAQIYRGFYALPDLADSHGNPTNAIFAVARFMLRLDADYRTDFGLVAFDKGRSRKRLDILPEYKATRPPMPDNLRCQIGPIREWVAAAGWPLLEEDGVEADDIIAAVAAVRGDRHLYIVSHDKDLAQLVATGVTQLVPAKKDGMEIMDAAAVKAKFGVPPQAVVDYLALLGDASDNIPGVPGVGVKTAAALLAQFGSVDYLLEHIEEVGSAAVREKITGARDVIDRNRRLVTLDASLVSGLAGIGDLRRQPPNWEALRSMAQRFEFNSILADIEKMRVAERSPTLF